MPNRRKYNPHIPEINAAWERMISRCYKPEHDKYRFYGGKGVRVCDEWRNDYMAFLTWSLANGWQIGLQIDKDTKGNGLLYSPETCAWITRKDNQRARKHLTKVIFKGKEVVLANLCEQKGLKLAIVQQRMKRDGLSLDQALSRPTGGGPQHFPHRKKYNHSPETIAKLKRAAQNRKSK